MSAYEKIASALVAICILAMLAFSYHEITESKRSDYGRGPNFEESLGQSFKMGTFTTELDKNSSDATEANCKPLEPVIIAALHDIDEHLEEQRVYEPGVFEVNQQTLDLLCHKSASLTLSNDTGEKLLIVKRPFTRSVPSGGSPEDVGTDVRIDATVVVPGALPPEMPTTYGDELIPDTYLDSDSAR